jgi:hypothetical protein
MLAPAPDTSIRRLSDWCRFGTQDSTAPGIRIERFMWGSWTPHKVKTAVSGCPRNCAEATCKDIGVICVDSGYEIHYAGAAGLEVHRTELLTTVRSEDEVIETTAAQRDRVQSGREPVRERHRQGQRDPQRAPRERAHRQTRRRLAGEGRHRDQLRAAHLAPAPAAGAAR